MFMTTYAKDNRTAHLIVRSVKSASYVTNNKRLLDVDYSTFGAVEANTNRHEASRGFFATAQLFVWYGSSFLIPTVSLRECSRKEGDRYGIEMEMQKKIAPKCSIFGIMMTPLGLSPRTIHFYRATHMHSADYAVERCLFIRPSVCLSVRLSHAESAKPINFFQHQVARPFWFFHTKRQTGRRYSDAGTPPP